MVVGHDYCKKVKLNLFYFCGGYHSSSFSCIAAVYHLLPHRPREMMEVIDLTDDDYMLVDFVVLLHFIFF
jgi:hypothetical protein